MEKIFRSKYFKASKAGIPQYLCKEGGTL